MSKIRKAPVALNVTHPPCQDPDCIVIMSNGMGVESQAIFERWYHEPETRPFASWSQVIVVTSQVGEEHRKDTIRDMEARTLPMIREVGCRFVELARRGPFEEDGIVVLQDTRQPFELHPDGVYKLSDELLRSGTVPQFGGEHRCAMKFKAFVIEAWLSYEFQFNHREAPIYHVFGYNAEEKSRIGKSDDAIRLHNGERQQPRPGRPPLMVFGFNSDEGVRVARSMAYDGPHRTGAYPLLEWGWDRQKCIDYIAAKSGIKWRKSHCSFCPFCAEAAKGEKIARERWDESPEETAKGLLVEFNSLCFNPRGQLYRDTALIDVIRKVQNYRVLQAFQEMLGGIEWGIYSVRRVYTKKGKAFRFVSALRKGSLEEMRARFEKIRRGTVTEDGSQLVSKIRTTKNLRDIEYLYFDEREEGVYPTREGYYVVAPGFMDDKLRGAPEMFDFRYEFVGAHGRLPTKEEDAAEKKRLKKLRKDNAQK